MGDGANSINSELIIDVSGAKASLRQMDEVERRQALTRDRVIRLADRLKGVDGKAREATTLVDRIERKIAKFALKGILGAAAGEIVSATGILSGIGSSAANIGTAAAFGGFPGAVLATVSELVRGVRHLFDEARETREKIADFGRNIRNLERAQRAKEEELEKKLKEDQVEAEASALEKAAELDYATASMMHTEDTGEVE
jgi:hypothetical protein